MFYKKEILDVDTQILIENNFEQSSSNGKTMLKYPIDIGVNYKPLHGYNLLNAFYLSIKPFKEGMSHLKIKPKFGSLFFLSCYGYLIILTGVLLLSIVSNTSYLLPLFIFIGQCAYFYSGVKKVNLFTKKHIENLLSKTTN